jgi:hypothetical protein
MRIIRGLEFLMFMNIDVHEQMNMNMNIHVHRASGGELIPLTYGREQAKCCRGVASPDDQKVFIEINNAPATGPATAAPRASPAP